MTRRDVGRRPEHEHAELVLDVMEAVLHARGDEDQAPGFHRPILIRDPYLAPAADHVVDLVLAVRLLPVGRAGGPDRQADTQLAGREKIDVAVTLGVARLRIKVRNFVRLHELTITTTGNAGTGG